MKSAIKLQSERNASGRVAKSFVKASEKKQKAKSKKKTGSRCQECSEEITIKGLLSAGNNGEALALVQTRLPRYSWRNIPLSLSLRDDTARNNLLRLLMKSNEISSTLRANLSRGGNRGGKKKSRKATKENDLGSVL
ncbi:hypothetical protein CDAR_35311 [Caerostris darwini]|uniref:Uncharacterized protein n=1 Tax=Caerostris darwini TaxID=1538125 RepID=A0AAV4SPM3_9ARAC|nr:hypothetical protein CDAR_35311 [Caerostris darwini]